MAARMPPALIAEVEAWAAANDATRSEAFRRLVEISEGENKMKRKAGFRWSYRRKVNERSCTFWPACAATWSRGGLQRLPHGNVGEHHQPVLCRRQDHHLSGGLPFDPPARPFGNAVA
jgi:hypothetical protein